jgi:hypothetical protein
MSLFRRVSNLFARAHVEQEIDAELRSHIEMRTADNMAAGMPPEEAQRDAMIRFGKSQCDEGKGDSDGRRAFSEQYLGRRGVFV